MFELERCQDAALVAAKTGEGDDGADVGAAGGDGRDLVGQVEILGLNADARLHGEAARLRSRAAAQPPVIGGKKATSRAVPIGASCCTWV